MVHNAPMRFVGALAVALVGCGDPVTEHSYVPPAGAGGAQSSGRTPNEARGVDLAAYTGQADLPERLCSDPFLSADFELGDQDELATLYVDASSPDNAPDGSREAPFQTLRDAFDAAEGPATILVAVGSYDDVVVPPGMRVLGGYDAEDWTLDADPASVSRLGAVGFTGASDPELISELANFRVEGTIAIGAQGRVILRDNVLIPELAPLAVIEPDPDRFSALAVHADSAFLRAQGNQVLLPTEEPELVRSIGFDLQKSCARIVSNDIEAYRTPLSARESELVFNFNFVAEGRNGVSLMDTVASLTGNYFHLAMLPPGRTYAVYLVRSQPVLRYNEFQLNGLGSAGLNEGTTDSDPLELVGNEFHLQAEAHLLYLDRQEDGPIADAQWVNDIETVNSLPDIPVLSGNIASLNP
jgi:hypothetical protein